MSRPIRPAHHQMRVHFGASRSDGEIAAHREDFNASSPSETLSPVEKTTVRSESPPLSNWTVMNGSCGHAS
jgi:hypothetical protein